VIYQHPLAYLVGLEGAALLRAFAGDYDRDFTNARLAEIQALLDVAAQFGDGADIPPVTTAEGYRAWAETYDQPGNRLIELEQPIVWQILDRLPVGTALDAACGTGRHAAHLAALGHTVIGVDSSAEMLARARQRSPAASSARATCTACPCRTSMPTSWSAPWRYPTSPAWDRCWPSSRVSCGPAATW
jgi:SAM-dependent methyltransferase